MRPAKMTRRQKERGNVLVYSVMSALFLFFAVGLGVDLSHLYLAKAELQNAADAGALAGASALNLPNPGRITTAVDRAVSTMNLNKYNFDNRNFSAVMTTSAQRTLVSFAVNLGGPYVGEETAKTTANIRFIKVSTPSVPISVIFASPILGSSKSLNANATAGLSIPGNVRFCPAPLAAVFCNPDDSTCVMEQQYWGTCPTTDPNGLQTYPDGTTCNPKKTFCKGCTYTIRFEGGNSVSPGNFAPLQCPGQGPGADDLQEALASYNDACPCGTLSPTDTVNVKTGVNANKVSSGLNVRFDMYSQGLNQNDAGKYPPDANIANNNWPQYQDGNPFLAPSHTGVTQRRVLVLPQIKNTDMPNGSGTARVSSFAGFFMQQPADHANSTIKVEFTGEGLSGAVGGDPLGGNQTNIVTPVLYR